MLGKKTETAMMVTPEGLEICYQKCELDEEET